MDCVRSNFGRISGDGSDGLTGKVHDRYGRRFCRADVGWVLLIRFFYRLVCALDHLFVRYSDNGPDAGNAPGSRRINLQHARVCMRRPEHARVEHARCTLVERIFRDARYLDWSIYASEVMIE